VASTGEVVSSGLFSLALTELGISSKPLSGWQVPILTDSQFGNAKIIDILPQKLGALMRQGIVPVVTGFQGMTLSQDITTLGRGGSDTSAVAIAAALKADLCDIYTDIDGIYSADPRFVPLAFQHPFLSYETALEMSWLGAKVLHPRCVQIAQRYNIPLRVLSSFIQSPGTQIAQIIPNNTQGGVNMENISISSITHTRDMVWIQFDQTLGLTSFFDLLSKHDVTIDMLQILPASFGCALALNDWNKLSAFLQTPLEIQDNLCRISFVGEALRSHPTLLQKSLLIMKDYPPVAIDLAQNRLSLLTPCDKPEIMVQILHDELILA
jgi:aspartate kinase